MADLCCSGACTCERGNALAGLTAALAVYEGMVSSMRQELLESTAHVSHLNSRIATLESKAQADLHELDRIRSECATLRLGWAEFERVGIAQEQVISRARRWARAWKAAAQRGRAR